VTAEQQSKTATGDITVVAEQPLRTGFQFVGKITNTAHFAQAGTAFEGVQSRCSNRSKS